VGHLFVCVGAPQNTMLRHAENCNGEDAGDENGTSIPKKGRRGRKRKMQSRMDDDDEEEEEDIEDVEDDDENTGVVDIRIWYGMYKSLDFSWDYELKMSQSIFLSFPGLLWHFILLLHNSSEHDCNRETRLCGVFILIISIVYVSNTQCVDWLQQQ